jgi:hypothetical protein
MIQPVPLQTQPRPTSPNRTAVSANSHQWVTVTPDTKARQLDSSQHAAIITETNTAHMRCQRCCQQQRTCHMQPTTVGTSSCDAHTSFQ